MTGRRRLNLGRGKNKSKKTTPLVRSAQQASQKLGGGGDADIPMIVIGSRRPNGPAVNPVQVSGPQLRLLFLQILDFPPAPKLNVFGTLEFT